MDLPKLDKGELGYARESATVQIRAEQITAWLYVADEPDATAHLRPYVWYKRFIVEGARNHRLPLEYIKHLEQIETDEDPNRARHNNRMQLRCSSSDS